LTDAACCAVDSSVLINFLALDRLDLLAASSRLQLVVPAEVIGEVHRKAQVRRLKHGIDRGLVRRVVLQGTEEIAVYQSLLEIIEPGEAACLSLAHHRGWLIACDEKRAFRREAKRLLSEDRLLTTASALLLAIRDGKLTVEEADRLKTKLEEHRFRMKIASFRDLL